VKHSFCYWMRIAPRITTDFHILQWTPKLSYNQKIICRCMYIFKHICAYMRSFFPQVLYTVWCLSELYTHRKVCKNNFQMFSNKMKNGGKIARVGTNVRARVFNAGLLARSHFASGQSCNRPIYQGFP
jgi:hypothetical protein